MKWGMPQCIICDRAFEFGCRIVTLCNGLASRGFSARHIATQLIRCVLDRRQCRGSPEGETKADFIAQMSISRKEARETVWWLRVAIKTRIVTAEEVGWS